MVGPDPLASVRTVPYDDKRSLLQSHKSPLSYMFTSSAYTAALILEAFLEPITSDESPPIPLSLLYRQASYFD